MRGDDAGGVLGVRCCFRGDGGDYDVRRRRQDVKEGREETGGRRRT